MPRVKALAELWNFPIGNKFPSVKHGCSAPKGKRGGAQCDANPKALLRSKWR
jgi:hypothetical protein